MHIDRVELIDRFYRAMPIIGIAFFVYQAIKSLDAAKIEDLAFARAMKSLDKEPPERLLNHSVKAEWYLINSIVAALFTIWFLTFFLFYDSIIFEFLFGIATVSAMILDYLSGKIAMKVFNFREKIRRGETSL